MGLGGRQNVPHQRARFNRRRQTRRRPAQAARRRRLGGVADDDSHAVDFPQHRLAHGKRIGLGGRQIARRAIFAHGGQHARCAADFGVGGDVFSRHQTRHERQRVGKNAGRHARTRLLRYPDYRRGRHVWRRVARIGHWRRAQRQHGAFGRARVTRLLFGGVGTAHRARLGNRCPNHRRWLDGKRRCRRWL